MQASFSDAQFPARPYPGARPDFSFVHVEGAGFAVEPSEHGWTVVEHGDLDVWLGAFGAALLADRTPVLAYGSNACPSKISWLRAEHGLTGPVVVLRAIYTGLAAVWAHGLRVVDEQRPATLAASDTVEQHAVWLATADQLGVLDVCEGRGSRYDLAQVHTGTVELENGQPLVDPLAYVGAAGRRMPILVDGAMVRCADVPQAEALALEGAPAGDDGLDLTRLPVGPRADT